MADATSATLSLPASATLEQAAVLVQALESAAASSPVAAGSGAALVVDASAVTAFDTSLVALLLHAQRLALASGRSFQVRGAPARLRELAALYGVAELLPLPASV